MCLINPIPYPKTKLNVKKRRKLIQIIEIIYRTSQKKHLTYF